MPPQIALAVSAHRFAVTVELDQADEVDWTQVWRLDQFLALGFDAVRASLMAEDPRVDLAQARKLVALGCPLDTALRILL